MPRCFLALGGNLGDVAQTFAETVRALARQPAVRVVRRSSIYRTSPVGERAGGDFRNAAVEIETEVLPHRLLQLAKQLEDEHGRGEGERWAPRPLDVDLIFYGKQVIDEPDLQVPHPACWYRRFVLDPLAEIAPEVLHPVKQVTVAALRRRLLVRPLRLALAGGTEPQRSRIISALVHEFPFVQVVDWAEPSRPSTAEPAVLAWLGCDEPGNATTIGWESLPRVPRLDASRRDDAAAFLRHVLQAASDEPERLGRVPV